MSKKSLNAKRIVELLEQTLSASIPISTAMEEIHGLDIPAHFTDPATNPSQTIKLEEILVYQLVLKACAGNDKSIQEVLDRLVGKPAQFVENHNTNFTYIDFMAKCHDDDLKAVTNDRFIEHDSDLPPDLLDELGSL